ncbi:MAG: sterol desaturase family protein [Pseudomonadales bacterium]|nr:sterol desaturase family protein [Pseudomonadales bacterium]
MISSVFEHYNWQAALVVVFLPSAIIQAGKYLAFKVPDIKRMRDINIAEDNKRLAQEKYPAMIRRGKMAGLSSLLSFFVFILPFCATFEYVSVGKVLFEIFVILMAYDLVYYLTHRFLLHASFDSRFAVLRHLRRVHAVHHQARDPSWVDATYVHPLEIAIGVWLFLGTLVGYALVAGPAHVASLVVCFIAFHVINQVNHTYFKLPYFPYRTISWVVAKHHVHHENMQKGNYATITLFYDRIFGTLD